MCGKIRVVLILVLFLSACSILSGTIEEDTVSFDQRSTSILTPIGGFPTEMDDENSAPRNPLPEASSPTARGDETTEVDKDGMQAQGETPETTATDDLGNPTTNTQAAADTAVPPLPATATNPVPTNPPPPTPTNTSPPPPTSTNTTAPTPTATNTEAPQATNTTASTNCDATGNSSYESQVIVLINQERAAEGLPALSSQSQLTSAARIHSEDMACNDYFSHNSPTTGSPFDRINDQGYSFSSAGENIAAGYVSPASTVETWMNSPGHRDNILNADYVHIGIGYAYWGESTYGAYWTAVFASP
jgi:uncharacterized YkwD family protein